MLQEMEADKQIAITHFLKKKNTSICKLTLC